MLYVCMVHRFAFSEEEEDWPRSRTCLVIFTNAVNYEIRAKVKHTSLDGLPFPPITAFPPGWSSTERDHKNYESKKIQKVNDEGRHDRMLMQKRGNL